jgi:hypothetical protein
VPGKNHAPDAVLFTVVIYLAFRYFRDEPGDRLPLAIGALIGFSATVRWFAGSEAVAFVLVLVFLRRWRHAALVSAATGVVIGLLFIIPEALGTPVFGGFYNPGNEVIFAPFNPLRMLFTDHRGMFVWSPVSALAVIGIVLLFRRRPEHRAFLSALIAMSVALVCAYSLVAYWDGTWSFGQRFYTPLLPFVAIGVAGLVDAWPRPAIVAAAATAAWSLFLAFNLVIIGGPQYNSDTPGGASDVALIPSRTHTSVGAYLWGLRHKSNLLR